MAFVLPTFNLECDVYTHVPFAVPTIVRFTTECQLRPPSMNQASIVATSSTNHCGMVLLVPKDTDLRDDFSAPGNSPDAIQCPPGSGRWYQCAYVDDVAKGFANEHRFAILLKGLVNWPVPMP